MNKIKLDIPVIVEGKYDVIKLNSIIDGQIIKTDGFGLFNSRETKEYIKKESGWKNEDRHCSSRPKHYRYRLCFKINRID